MEQLPQEGPAGRRKLWGRLWNPVSTPVLNISQCNICNGREDLRVTFLNDRTTIGGLPTPPTQNYSVPRPPVLELAGPPPTLLHTPRPCLFSL